MNQPAVNGQKVMIVEDDDDVRAITARFLHSLGYQAIQAANSAEAQRYALEGLPDLILMDIDMPQVDGLTAVWRMRENPALAEIPVVILSAYDSYDLRAEAASTGCQGYLTKPVEPDQLRSMITQILEK